MKEQFDHVLKSKIAELNQVPGVPYNKEKVWKTIYPRIRIRSSWNLFKIFTVGFILMLGIVTLYIHWPKKALEVQKNSIDAIPKAVLKQDEGIKIQKEDAIDTIAKPENISGQDSLAETNTVIDTHSHSYSTPKKVKVKPLKPKLNVSIIDVATESTKVSTTIAERRKAVVHIYRPKRFVGSSLVFRLNGNDKLISRVKNNSHTMVYLNPEFMKFTIGKSELPLVLKPGKIYHIWVSYEGFPIGKVVLKNVDKSFINANK